MWGRRKGGGNTGNSQIRNLCSHFTNLLGKGSSSTTYLSKPLLIIKHGMSITQSQHSWQHPTPRRGTLSGQPRKNPTPSPVGAFNGSTTLTFHRWPRARYPESGYGTFLNAHCQFLSLSPNQGKKQTSAKGCSREREGRARNSFQEDNCGSVEGATDGRTLGAVSAQTDV